MHTSPAAPTFTCFQGHQRVASGPLAVVASALRRLRLAGGAEPLLVFDDQTGRSLDIDTRGGEAEMQARLALAAAATQAAAPSEAPAAAESAAGEGAPGEARGRGRPKLGVVAKEVTLLPRHWEWLAAQPGGASVVLRKLVEEARRTGADKERLRQAQERAYHFMSAMAGDFPGFEEAARALFANDAARLEALMAAWPGDVRAQVHKLAFATP